MLLPKFVSLTEQNELLGLGLFRVSAFVEESLVEGWVRFFLSPNPVQIRVCSCVLSHFIFTKILYYRLGYEPFYQRGK